VYISVLPLQCNQGVSRIRFDRQGDELTIRRPFRSLKNPRTQVHFLAKRWVIHRQLSQPVVTFCVAQELICRLSGDQNK